MSPVVRGLIVAALHVALVASLGAKYLWERQTLPRVWVRATPYDPNLPLRGRYLRLQVLLDPSQVRGDPDLDTHSHRYSNLGPAVSLSVDHGRLIATAVPDSTLHLVSLRGADGYTLDKEIVYFIPERIADPSRRPAGEELWVESSIPSKGLPRAIRLGVRKNEGAIAPLSLD